MVTVFRLLLLPLLLVLALPAAAQKTSEPQAMPAPGEPTEPPKPRAAPIGTVEMASLPRAGGVLVFSDMRGTGLEVVKKLIEMKEQVTVVTQGQPDDPALKAMGVTVARGNVFDPESLKEVFTATPYRIVISMIDRTGDGPASEFDGNKNVIDAAKGVGISRFILVSAIGAGDSAQAPNWILRLLHKDTFVEKGLAEAYLKTSGLDYTIVRQGSLLDRAPSGHATLVEDLHAYSWIAPEDISPLVAACVRDEKAIKKTYAAFDPTRASLFALIRDWASRGARE